MYQMKDNFSDIYKLQIKKMLGNISKEKKNESALVKKQLSELKNKKDKFEERFAYGEKSEEMYMKLNTKIMAEIAELKPDFDMDEKTISNFQSQ